MRMKKREGDGDERGCVLGGFELWERKEEKGRRVLRRRRKKNSLKADQKTASARGGSEIFRMEATKLVPFKYYIT